MPVADANTADRYPTRLSAESRMLVRSDPAVWSDVDTGLADFGDLAAHERNGWHAVALLSAGEVHHYSQELQRLIADPQVRTDERAVVDEGTDEVRSIFDVHRLCPAIVDLIHDPRVLDRARRILGSEVYVHQSRLTCLPGCRGGGVYWHSDFETWHAEDGMPAPRAVGLSIALTDNHPFNGERMVMPGAHRTFVSCAGETSVDNDSAPAQQSVGVPDEDDIATLAYAHGIEQFTGPAGSAWWFDANAMHGSGDNIAPFPQATVVIAFNSVHNTLERPFAAGQPRPDFLASRDFTPIPR